MLTSLLLVLNVVVAILLVILVLLQRADEGLGGAFGGGGNAPMPSGKDALTRATAVLATIFMVSCLVLAALSVGQGRSKSVVETVIKEEPDVPTVAPLNDEMPESQ